MNAFETLTLTVEAKGEVLSSNLVEYRAAVRDALSKLNRDLQSDEDFGQAELDVKGLKHAEEVVREAKRKALEDAESLHAFFSALDESAEEVRQARLELEKLIRERKERIRKELVEEALSEIDCDPGLKSKFSGMIDSAIKGKKTVDSIKKGLRSVVIAVNAGIGESRKLIAAYKALHGDYSVPDENQLELAGAASVKIELQRRADLKKADEEKARLMEEAAQARREAEEARKESGQEKEAPTPSDTPPQLTPDPLEQPQDTALAEWERFKGVLLAAFGQIRNAKQNLIFPRNKERAEFFARTVNEAWKIADKGGQNS